MTKIWVSVAMATFSGFGASIDRQSGCLPEVNVHFTAGVTMLAARTAKLNPCLACSKMNQNLLAVSQPIVGQAGALSAEDEKLRLEGRRIRQEGLDALKRNDFVLAGDRMEQALAIQRKLRPKERFPDGHWELAEAIFDVSTVYLHTQPGAGEPLCRESLEMLRRVQPVDSGRTAYHLDTLALFRKGKDSVEGENLIRQAMEIRIKLKLPLGTSFRALGSIYRDRVENAKAEKYYRESVDAFRKAKNEYELATTLNVFGGLLAGSGKHKEAEESLNEAIELFRKISPKGSDLAGSLVSLGGAYIAQKKFELALSAVEEGKDIFLAAPGGVMRPTVRYAYQKIGLIHLQRGDLQKAEDNFRTAVDLFRKNVQDSTREHPFISMDLAQVLSKKGEYAAAATITRRLLSDLVDEMDRMAGGQSEQNQLNLLQSKMYYLSHHVTNCESAGISSEATYDLVLRWKGLVTRRQLLTRAARQGAASGDPTTSALFAELEKVVRKYSGLTSATASAAQKAGIEKIDQQREELEEQLSRRTDAFRRTRLASRMTPADLCKSLPKDVALVDYLVYRREDKKEWSVVAFVVREESIESVWLGSLKNETEAMSLFQSSVAQGRSLTGPTGVAAKQVRDYLWEPVRKKLAGAKVVLISPDKEICSIPFAALPSADGKGYLLEEVALAQVLVPQTLPDLLSGGVVGHNETASFLAVGDVDFDGAKDSGPAAPSLPKADPKAEIASTRALTDGVKWSALPGTRDEVQSLERLFKSTAKDGRIHVLRAKNATEAAFRQHAPQHRMLHIASHGFFATGDESSKHTPGLRVGIVFAGANNRNAEGDDGVLTALEAANLDLSKVDLVVLSACETGLGTATGGEGLVGLQRALQIAGARATCTSLWKVDDEATRRLMERFYENLWSKKMGRLAALHEAQLWMLNEGKSALSESTLRGISRLEPLPSARVGNRLPPYLWAAFTLSGDWR